MVGGQAPPVTALQREYVVDEEDLELYRQRVSESLKRFEEELCEHMENVSQRAVESVKKKFISFELSDGKRIRESPVVQLSVEVCHNSIAYYSKMFLCGLLAVDLILSCHQPRFWPVTFFF